jgi:hypothetical protein
MNEDKKRCSDGWFYTMLPKAIEIVAVIAVIYGGVKVTLAALVNDMNGLKADCKIYSLKINTLETKFEYIQDSLNRIEKKLK